jgi:hypothetical protein
MCSTPDRPAQVLKPTETVMKLTINWTKFAESLAPLNPYGPFFASDGSIYGCDGRLLVGPRDGSAAPVVGSAIGHTVTEPAAASTARAPIGQPAYV